VLAPNCLGQTFAHFVRWPFPALMDPIAATTVRGHRDFIDLCSSLEDEAGMPPACAGGKGSDESLGGACEEGEANFGHTGELVLPAIPVLADAYSLVLQALRRRSTACRFPSRFPHACLSLAHCSTLARTVLTEARLFIITLLICARILARSRSSAANARMLQAKLVI
jgi:hypothetical protein